MGHKDRSRNLARDRFWEEHDKESYRCPGCGRGIDETDYPVEVHHKNGEPFDNSKENLVGLCRLCHMLREGKKPSVEQIRELRDQYDEMTVEVPDSAYFYVMNRTREPVDPPWVNPIGVYWDDYESYFEETPLIDEKATITGLLNALEMFDGVEIEYSSGGVQVWGRELD